MRVLVTGVCGFIGSNTACKLLEHGHDVVGVDNLSRGKLKVVKQIERLSKKKMTFHCLDVLDTDRLASLMNDIDCVIHFAGYKSVAESVSHPEMYRENNYLGTVSVAEAMKRTGVEKIIFSSSASVYGESGSEPLMEINKTEPTNPYAQSKLDAEAYLKNSGLNAFSLRYFNPIGSHSSGLLFDDQRERPTNLVPVLMDCLYGSYNEFNLYGDDYNTVDGSCVRDYIHVMDVAEAHVYMATYKMRGSSVFNIGLGVGVSVKQLICMCEDITGRSVHIKTNSRRAGDVETLIANPSRFRYMVGWRAKRSVKEALIDAVKFYKDKEKY